MGASDQGIADPARYIERVNLVTGDVIDGVILPEQLLVQKHRDYHIVDVQARVLMSLLVDATGDEEAVRFAMKQIRRVGKATTSVLGKFLGDEVSTRLGKALFGYKEKDYYFRYKKHELARREIYARIELLQDEARDGLAELRDDEDRLRLRVLLTGGTGFVGKEIMSQAAVDDEIEEMVVVVRPKQVRDRKTGQVIETISPAERGERLLDQLDLDPTQLSKFRFVAGDVELPGFGLDAHTQAALTRTLTHVIHSAACVSFDSPYDEAFRANVLGTLNALAFSHALQQAPGSPFVMHVGIETSYIHGRQVREKAREDEVIFPRNFYNNYYELTKAMASIETERFMLERGLRVAQLCPAIVIGAYRTGNNRGDTKVVNAPVNVFGRAQEALQEEGKSWLEWSKARVLARMACIFPGDPSAELNLIPVDWVVTGVLAALRRSRAVGERIHLATDQRITSEHIRDTVAEELGVKIRLAEPTLHRNLTLPALTRVLQGLGQDRLSRALEKLGTIFGGYSEWGQPIHEVGKDVKLLGLEEPRPNTGHAFRMLCRHNRYVQDFGRVKDLDEIARREVAWSGLCQRLEQKHGQHPGALSTEAFQSELAAAPMGW